MERRKHKVITNKILKQPYYFSEWDYCKNCKHVQHYNKYKQYGNKYKQYGNK